MWLWYRFHCSQMTAIKVKNNHFTVCVLSLFSPVWLFVTLWTVASSSMEFYRQKYCSRLSCLPLGDLSDPGIKPVFLTSPALAGGLVWYKSKCGFTLLKFAIWYWNTFLNKCAYVIHDFNAHFLLYFFANELLLAISFIYIY